MSRHVEVRRSKPDDFLAIEELIAQGDAGPVVESRFGKTPLTELLCVGLLQHLRVFASRTDLFDSCWCWFQRLVVVFYFSRW
jgi:hypothetical protein